jgi:hypothetical protein
MAAGMGKMLIMLPVMFLMREINFEEPTNLFYVRIAFGSVALLTVMTLYYIYSRIQSQADNRRKITVAPPATPSWGAAAEPQPAQEMTVREYDYSEFKKALQQTLISIAIVSFLHWKWAICPPLFIQCFMTPSTLYSNPLFKIYVLGHSADQKDDELQRPFKDNSNPFGALLAGNTEPETPQEKKKKKRQQQLEAATAAASAQTTDPAEATSAGSDKASASSAKKRKPQPAKVD